MKDFIKKAFQFPIRLYQKYISPLYPPVCKYVPSCSRYMLDAIDKFGVIRGIALGTIRIIRCNPWSLGGIDPVPEKFDLFYWKKK